MSRLYKTHGIVLKRSNYGEADRIITILTPEYGKLKVIAKGIRKITSRRAGHLEIFTHAQFMLFHGKTFDHVTEVVTKTSYPEFSRDLQKASFCYYLCELTDRLVPEKQESYEMFELLQGGITDIARSKTEGERHEHIYTFALEALWLLGFLPRSKTIPVDQVRSFIESLIERKLKTPKLMEKT